MLNITDPAPHFSLLSDNNEIVSLTDFAGKKVILYFYPKDDTPGCTKQACRFRDHWQEFKKLNIKIVGISKDSVKSHQKFKEKYQLPFILLSDENHEVCEKYGVWVEKSLFVKKYFGIARTTFLIDEQGKIAKIWPRVKVQGHVEEIKTTITVI